MSPCKQKSRIHREHYVYDLISLTWGQRTVDGLLIFKLPPPHCYRCNMWIWSYLSIFLCVVIWRNTILYVHFSIWDVVVLIIIHCLGLRSSSSFEGIYLQRGPFWKSLEELEKHFFGYFGKKVCFWSFICKLWVRDILRLVTCPPYFLETIRKNLMFLVC